VPLLTSAEKSAQRRGLPTKTIKQQRDADTWGFPLFLCLTICLHSALSETNFGRSVIFFASLRYVRLATNMLGETFSWSSDMWMTYYFKSIIVYRKKVKYLLIKVSYLIIVKFRKLNLVIMLCLRIIHFY